MRPPKSTACNTVTVRATTKGERGASTAATHTRKNAGMMLFKSWDAGSFQPSGRVPVEVTKATGS